MAHQIVLGYSSDSSKFVEVDDDISPSHSSIGNNNSLGPIVSSHSGSVDWVSSISSPSVSSYSGLVDLASSISLILHTVNARMRTP
jgi:hypothetical protein